MANEIVPAGIDNLIDAVDQYENPDLGRAALALAREMSVLDLYTLEMGLRAVRVRRVTADDNTNSLR